MYSKLTVLHAIAMVTKMKQLRYTAEWVGARKPYQSTLEVARETLALWNTNVQ